MKVYRVLTNGGTYLVRCGLGQIFKLLSEDSKLIREGTIKIKNIKEINIDEWIGKEEEKVLLVI